MQKETSEGKAKRPKIEEGTRANEKFLFVNLARLKGERWHSARFLNYYTLVFGKVSQYTANLHQLAYSAKINLMRKALDKGVSDS